MLQYKKIAYLTATILLLLSIAFVACKCDGAPESNDSIRYPDGMTVAAPDNLVAYFDSMLRYTPAFI